MNTRNLSHIIVLGAITLLLNCGGKEEAQQK